MKAILGILFIALLLGLGIALILPKHVSPSLIGDVSPPEQNDAIRNANIFTSLIGPVEAKPRSAGQSGTVSTVEQPSLSTASASENSPAALGSSLNSSDPESQSKSKPVFHRKSTQKQGKPAEEVIEYEQSAAVPVTAILSAATIENLAPELREVVQEAQLAFEEAVAPYRDQYGVDSPEYFEAYNDQAKYINEFLRGYLGWQQFNSLSGAELLKAQEAHRKALGLPSSGN